MLEDVRKYMEAMLDKLTPSKAQAMARSLAAGGGRDQVNKMAKDLMEWSQRGRERLVELVQREVQSQLKNMGVATKDDLEALRKRVRELERRQGSAKGTVKRGPAKRSAAKRTTTKASGPTQART